MTGTEGFPKASWVRDQVAEMRHERRQQYLRELRQNILQALKKAPGNDTTQVLIKVPDDKRGLTDIVVAELEKQGYTVNITPEPPTGTHIAAAMQLVKGTTYSDMVISFALPQAK